MTHSFSWPSHKKLHLRTWLQKKSGADRYFHIGWGPSPSLSCCSAWRTVVLLWSPPMVSGLAYIFIQASYCGVGSGCDTSSSSLYPQILRSMFLIFLAPLMASISCDVYRNLKLFDYNGSLPYPVSEICSYAPMTFNQTLYGQVQYKGNCTQAKRYPAHRRGKTDWQV